MLESEGEDGLGEDDKKLLETVVEWTNSGLEVVRGTEADVLGSSEKKMHFQVIIIHNSDLTASLCLSGLTRRSPLMCQSSELGTVKSVFWQLFQFDQQSVSHATKQ